MRNNIFTFTIVFGKMLPFPSIFQSAEFTEQLTYCFHFLKEWIYCFMHGWIKGKSRENLSQPTIGGTDFAGILPTGEQ